MPPSASSFFPSHAAIISKNLHPIKATKIVIILCDRLDQKSKTFKAVARANKRRSKSHK
jgi:hypothetical protein